MKTRNKRLADLTPKDMVKLAIFFWGLDILNQAAGEVLGPYIKKLGEKTTDKIKEVAEKKTEEFLSG